MIKLYLDEDVHKKIALSLRLKGYDVISAHEVQNQGIPDYKQLQYAISQQRVFFVFSVGAGLNFLRLKRFIIMFASFLQKRLNR